MYFAQLQLRDSLKAFWIIFILAALAFGILSVSDPYVTQAAICVCLYI
jgi:hypothetical protein